jgi:hypothetical protein
MDPNGEGYKPENLTDGPNYPELEVPIGLGAQVEATGVEGQDFVNPGESIEGQYFVEDVEDKNK